MVPSVVSAQPTTRQHFNTAASTLAAGFDANTSKCAVEVRCSTSQTGMYDCGSLRGTYFDQALISHAPVHFSGAERGQWLAVLIRRREDAGLKK